MGLADASSRSYETEFPTLGSLVLDENTTEVHDETVKDSSFDAVSDDRQENDGLAVIPIEQAEEKFKDSDSVEDLVGFWKYF